MLKTLALFGIFVGLLADGYAALAQTTTAPTTPIEVKTSDDPSVIPDLLFAAMKAKNAVGMQVLFVPEGRLVAIDKPKDGVGPSKTRMLTGDAFARAISGATGSDYRELMPNKSVQVKGDLALVAGRYTFYVGEKFSHCGTNAFHLIRTRAGWKILALDSTLEFQCEAELKAVIIPVVSPRPADVGTLDGIIKAFYETISGPKGQPRQWSRDRGLYVSGVRFIQLSKNNDLVQPHIMEYLEYVNETNEYLVRDGFTERELHRVTRRFGNLAQVFSTYEWQSDEKKASGRGINSIELFWDGSRWWISAASWEAENRENPIPAEFLPKQSAR
ncbi:MAG: hypothetical protein ABIP75_05430 [Pyrinomonadaceae bacterium]